MEKEDHLGQVQRMIKKLDAKYREFEQVKSDWKKQQENEIEQHEKNMSVLAEK